MKKCTSCNKITQTKTKCYQCGKPLCSDCRNKRMLCKECLVISDEKNMVQEYFREKYAIKAISLVVLIILLVPFVWSQLSTSDYKKTCVSVNDDYYVKEPVYEYKLVFNATTGKNDNITTIKAYQDILVKRNKDVCNETVTINNKDVDFKLQGYNCKNLTGEVICDSCIDGNCDGICSSNGGETCARIKNGIVQYKNSVVSWDEKSALLPVGMIK